MEGMSWLTFIKFGGVLVAAILLGNWFLAEVRKASRQQQPWYKPYLSLPGLLILLALCLPLIYLIIV